MRNRRFERRVGAHGFAHLLAALLALAPSDATARASKPSAEARTAAHLARIADSPPRLRIFLQEMPKGADLHNHAGGAIYAEDFLRWAAAAGLCLAADPIQIVNPPCDALGRIAARGLERDYPRYAAAIDGFSTRGFEAGVGNPAVSGYDRFFSTFDAFGPAAEGHEAEIFALAREQAAADRVSYAELGVGTKAARPLVAAIGEADASDLAGLYARISPLLPKAVADTRAEYDGYDAELATLHGCGTATPKPACYTELRYLYTAIRTLPPAQVFTQLALGFALVENDPRFVGVNIAAPEHDPVAVRDYALHMRMFAFLKARSPRVPLSLHAGELTLGLVPPRDLTFHIHDAVAVAGARRIGHGIDISYEIDARALLARMARERVAVEINLTSNAVILGVNGRSHPLSLYREAGVPVVLSTDDEGVSRSDMTNEYLRAVVEQKLGYRDLKQIVRDGMQHSFLPGGSLWSDRAGGMRVAECVGAASISCMTYLAKNPKAARQAKLEIELSDFEATHK
ncbi:adenosine deaminase [uncultured Sphingomonas sp.]|uniref:adenosine deaminase family protein n=1 Tax=uncultured Sphingomonas sp. TaxID=158754 RepID=UPI0035CA620A